MATEVDATENIPHSEEPELAPKEDETVLTSENQENIAEVDQGDQTEQIEQDENKASLELFKNFDTEKNGRIKAENMHEIAAILGKDKNQVDEILKNNGKSKGDTLSLEEYQQIVAELDRPNISVIESDRSRQSQKIVITPDAKVVELIRLLYAFQMKCENEGKYGEAKLAQEKIEDTKLKEILRQENSIRSFQEEELAQVENAQKEQFLAFNKVWDNYMSEYEATALTSLEKLKEKHIKEVEELHQRLKRDLAFHFKSSKQLIELRQKEVALAKMKKYSEAEKIKAQADALEQWERNNKEKEIEEIIDKKTLALRKQQQRGLSVLLKRIQKDRNQQLKNREVDSQKLVLKNKNLRNELLSKHAAEAKNALEIIRSNLSVVNAAQSLKVKSPTLDKSTMRSEKNQASPKIEGDI